MEFTGSEAREWAEQGKLMIWIQHFLRNADGAHANPNVGFADGLLIEPRFYIGPMQLPLDAICTVRVESDISDTRELAEFRRKVDAIGEMLPEWDMPPFLVQFRDGALWLTDGNHRYTALCKSGAETGCAIVWGNLPSEAEAYEYLRSITAD